MKAQTDGEDQGNSKEVEHGAISTLSRVLGKKAVTPDSTFFSVRTD